MLGTGLYLALIALFFDLFAPVDRRLSRVAAFLGVTGCAVQAVGTLLRSTPLVILGGGGMFVDAFPIEQRQALAALAIKVHAQSLNVSLFFFGSYCFFLGCLILRSAFLPRFLGILLVLAGAGWLSFLYPPLAYTLLAPLEMLGVLAEMALMFWLIAFGVNVERWREQVDGAIADSQEI